MSIRVEVCERASDYYICLVRNHETGEVREMKRPRYHAQIAGCPELWGAGISPAEAIGDLILSHRAKFDLEISFLEGPQAR